MKHRQMIAGMLKGMRKAKGFSQSDLAQAMGTTQSTIAKQESGKVNITIDTLDAISSACDCDIEIIYKKKGTTN